MAKDVMKTVEKRLKDGWLKAWMAVEVLAVTKEAADSSLHKHVERMEEEESSIIYKSEFKMPQKVPHPFKKGEDAYSKVVEVELVSRRFEDLIYMVMKYAPSSIEILEPPEIKMKVGEAQGILNSIAELIHSFAMASSGAITIAT